MIVMSIGNLRISSPDVALTHDRMLLALLDYPPLTKSRVLKRPRPEQELCPMRTPAFFIP